MEINRSRHITYTEGGWRESTTVPGKKEKVKRKGCMLFAPGEGSERAEDAMGERWP